MSDRSRYLQQFVAEDLKSRMVLIAGPRQVGKTTMALSFLDPPSEEDPGYINWDAIEDRQDLLSGNLPLDQPLIILDEIHKYHEWRNLLKGLFDKHRSKRRFLVTGSARLDYYTHGGDSMQGRYFLYRLHPYSLRELDSTCTRTSLDHLLEFGGFPEPLFLADKRFWRRWQQQRTRLIFAEDLLDLEHVKEIAKLKLLVDLLPKRVGAPLSITNLQSDLNVSYDTVERWLHILDNLFLSFRIAPFGSPKIKAVKKEQKVYLWDWSVVPEKGVRFENLVAAQLLKYCHFIEDTEGRSMELRYLRDYSKREVDFVVLEDGKPQFAVECKSGDRDIASSIKYFSSRAGIPEYYQVHLGERAFEHESYKTKVMPFEQFVLNLEMP